MPTEREKERHDKGRSISTTGKFFAPVVLAIVLLAIGYFFERPNDHLKKSGYKETNAAGLPRKEGAVRKDSNTLPMVTDARLQLESVGNTERVRVVIEEKQHNGKAVTYKYEWSKNGQPFGDKEDNVTGFKRGDKIDLKVTPFDGIEYGQPSMLSFIIAHVPPKIVENRAVDFHRNVLSYQVKAVDPDGGTLSYSLVGAPSNMTIDSQTGMITWPIDSKEAAKSSVEVRIRSTAGGDVIYPLNIDVARADE